MKRDRYGVFIDTWDEQLAEYKLELVLESNDAEKAIKVYNSIVPDADIIQVELWHETEERDDRIMVKDSSGYEEVLDDHRSEKES